MGKGRKYCSGVGPIDSDCNGSFGGACGGGALGGGGCCGARGVGGWQY